jgi:hypothetical protein
MAKITSEELSPELLNLINNDNGNIDDSIELALLGKELIADVVGYPLEPTDSFRTMYDKINIIKDTFKQKLIESGIELPDKEFQLIELIDKLNVFVYNYTYVTDIKTDWVNRGSGTPDTWTETELVYTGKSTHNKGAIYKDMGNTDGNIKFEFSVNKFEHYTEFSIFRVRSTNLTAGQYYNVDTFEGFEIYFKCNKSENTGAMYIRLPNSNEEDGFIDVNNVTIEVNRVYTIEVKWTSLGFTIFIDNEQVASYIYPLGRIDNYTIVELGYAYYTNMTATRKILLM